MNVAPISGIGQKGGLEDHIIPNHLLDNSAGSGEIVSTSGDRGSAMDSFDHARGLLEIGHRDAASAVLATIADLPAARRLLDIIALQSGDGTAAARLLESEMEDPEACADQALALQLTGDGAGARDRYRALIERFPDLEVARARLAALLVQTGRWDHAETVLLTGLQHAPRAPSLLGILARLLERTDRLEAAGQAWIDLAALRGQAPLPLLRAAEALASKGMTAEALDHARRALALAPDWTDALMLASRMAQGAGDLGLAQVMADRLVALVPTDQEAVARQAHVAHGRGDLAQAEALARRSVEMRDNASARTLLSMFALDGGRPAEAVAHADAALRLGPAPAAGNNRALALIALGRLDEAEAQARAVVDELPRWSIAQLTLAGALRAAGNIGAALRAVETALRMNDRYVDAWISAAGLLTRSERPTHAIHAGHRALGLRPDDPLAHWNLSLALLQAGRFEEGWIHYEHRSRTTLARLPGQPPADLEWDGTDHDGPLLVLGEQGFGDTIQFARFLPGLAARRPLTVRVQPALAPLVTRMLGPSAIVIADGDEPPVMPWTRLMSLPFRLGLSTPAALGMAAPYILPDPMSAAAWAGRLRSERRPKVGLCWRGNPKHEDDRRRSLDIGALAPLLGHAGIAFYGLQIDPREEENTAAITQLGPHLTSFEETVGALANMDLVISCDTAIAHLAGAMGRPVWTLLSHGPDWRWMIDREDSPWYPSMRLFRQTTPGDWAEVVTRVAAEAARLTSQRDD